MGTLPGFLLRDTVTVEPYVGPGAVYGSAQTVKGHVQEGRKLVKSDGVASEATINVFLRLGPVCPVGSRVTVRGTVCTAITVDVNDTKGLPTPDHLDIWCERADFLPTASLDLIRGTAGRNAFSDVVSSTTVISSELPAHVIETKQSRPGPEGQRAGVVETYTIRLRPGTDVREGDRLSDTARGVTYVVQSVIWSPSPLADGDDVRVTARRVTAHSTTGTELPAPSDLYSDAY